MIDSVFGAFVAAEFFDQNLSLFRGAHER